MGIIKNISQRLILNLAGLFIKEVKNDFTNSNKGYIIASNHASHIDPFIIAFVLYKKQNKIPRFLGKEESTKNFVWRFLYRTFDVIPINRALHHNKAILAAIKSLKANQIVGIFPEGTRTSNGKIQKGKVGVAKMALVAKAPIIPVAVSGTFKIWPRQRKFPKIKRHIKINIGKPINPPKFYHTKLSNQKLRKLTNLIMGKIEKLHREIKH